ncbi:Lrp/AsnC family transcriptional regulator [Ostreiculturibacter nitratireducens]|uniref:Lrp/AsnC family transcriptional regulator n=1 Tax=Ostreiculturibacter nitratireducens TaxID=3075226 RepID=UPI0031B64102
MDDLDQRLLSELRRDGRAALSDLAGRLGVARATVRARIERLMQRGEIVGFTVVTRGDVSQAPVRGLMMIEIEGRWADRVMARLSGLPEVSAVHSTNGRWDLVAEIGTRTLEEFDAVLARVRGFEGVASSETNLLLATKRAGRKAV